MSLSYNDTNKVGPSLLFDDPTLKKLISEFSETREKKIRQYFAKDKPREHNKQSFSYTSPGSPKGVHDEDWKAARHTNSHSTRSTNTGTPACSFIDIDSDDSSEIDEIQNNNETVPLSDPDNPWMRMEQEIDLVCRKDPVFRRVYNDIRHKSSTSKKPDPPKSPTTRLYDLYDSFSSPSRSNNNHPSKAQRLATPPTKRTPLERFLRDGFDLGNSTTIDPTPDPTHQKEHTSHHPFGQKNHLQSPRPQAHGAQLINPKDESPLSYNSYRKPKMNIDKSSQPIELGKPYDSEVGIQSSFPSPTENLVHTHHMKEPYGHQKPDPVVTQPIMYPKTPPKASDHPNLHTSHPSIHSGNKNRMNDDPKVALHRSYSHFPDPSIPSHTPRQYPGKRDIHTHHLLRDTKESWPPPINLRTTQPPISSRERPDSYFSSPSAKPRGHHRTEGYQPRDHHTPHSDIRSISPTYSYLTPPSDSYTAMGGYMTRSEVPKSPGLSNTHQPWSPHNSKRGYVSPKNTHVSIPTRDHDLTTHSPYIDDNMVDYFPYVTHSQDIPDDDQRAIHTPWLNLQRLIDQLFNKFRSLDLDLKKYKDLYWTTYNELLLLEEEEKLSEIQKSEMKSVMMDMYDHSRSQENQAWLAENKWKMAQEELIRLYEHRTL